MGGRSRRPRSWRASPTSRPLVAATSSRRCVSAKRRRWIAQASSDSPGISTERRSASGLAAFSSITAGSVMLGYPERERVMLFLVDDLGPKLAQLRLDGALVRWTHADQQLLPGRAPLEIRIRVLVHHPGLHQRDRRLHHRRLQQMIDHLDQAVVEVFAGVAEVLVGLLEERIEPPEIGRASCRERV